MSGKLKFEGRSLRDARELRGLTQVDLAKIVGISTCSIGKYESGDAPSKGVINRLALGLQVPPSFFSSSICSSLDDSTPIFFGAIDTISPIFKRSAIAQLAWHQFLLFYVAQWVEKPNEKGRGFPKFHSFSDVRDIDEDYIEAAALELRSHWGLSLGPISSISCLLFNKDVMLGRTSFIDCNLNSISHRNFDEPLILVSSDIKCGMKLRMEICYQLGHQLLHRNIPRDGLKSAAMRLKAERQAWHFAEAFMLPGDALDRDLNVGLSPRQLVERWKVWPVHIFNRMACLGMISKSAAQARIRDAMTGSSGRDGTFSSLGKSLAGGRGREGHSFLYDAFKVLLDEGVQTPDQISEALHLFEDDIEDLAGLPDNFFGRWRRTNTVSNLLGLKHFKRRKFDWK